MAQSIQDILLAVRNARKCEHCTRLLFPSSSECYTCGCSKGTLIPASSILNKQGQKAALLASGDVKPDSFGAVEQHMAFIANLPTSRVAPNGLLVGDQRVKKKTKWTKKYVTSANEIVAIDGLSAIPTVWVFEIL